MRRYINNMVSVIYTLFRFVFYRMIGLKIKFSLIERISPNVVIELHRKGNLHLGMKTRIHSGSKIKVRENAFFTLGDNVRINYGCVFVCHQKIYIEDGVEFGPNVLIYDHDHDFYAENGIKSGKFKCSPVKIGKNTWIGANTVILKGTNIGQNCVIAAGSIITGDVPDNTLFIQTRNNTMKKIR